MLKTSVLVCTFVAYWFVFKGSFGSQNQEMIPELTSEPIALLRTVSGVSTKDLFTPSYSVDKNVPELTPERIEILKAISGISKESQRSKR